MFALYRLNSNSIIVTTAIVLYSEEVDVEGVEVVERDLDLAEEEDIVFQLPPLFGQKMRRLWILQLAMFMQSI